MACAIDGGTKREENQRDNLVFAFPILALHSAAGAVMQQLHCARFFQHTHV